MYMYMYSVHVLVQVNVCSYWVTVALALTMMVWMLPHTYRQCLLPCLAALDRQAGVAASSLAGKAACSWRESRAEKGIEEGRDHETNFKLYARVATQMMNQWQCNHGRCWTTVPIRTKLLSAPDVNSTDNNAE